MMDTKELKLNLSSWILFFMIIVIDFTAHLAVGTVLMNAWKQVNKIKSTEHAGFKFVYICLYLNF